MSFKPILEEICKELKEGLQFRDSGEEIEIFQAGKFIGKISKKSSGYYEADYLLPNKTRMIHHTGSGSSLKSLDDLKGFVKKVLKEDKTLDSIIDTKLLSDPKISLGSKGDYLQFKFKAKRIGSGSSRDAYVINYKGRKTVIKIATSEKGLAQNEEEVGNLEDPYIKKLKVMIPLIDYDRKNQKPIWIHTELAEKATYSQFKAATGIDDLQAFLIWALEEVRRVELKDDPLPRIGKETSSKVNDYRVKGFKNIKDKDLLHTFGKIKSDSSFVKDFIKYVDNYRPNLDDLTTLDNWGYFGGRPVIIDVGFNSTIWQKYYQ